MPIPVACKCGRKFAAPDHLAGKQVACPGCKQPITISAAAAKPRSQTPPARPAAPPNTLANSSNQDGFWDDAKPAAPTAAKPAADASHGGDSKATAKMLREAAASSDDEPAAKATLADRGSQNLGIGLALAVIGGILTYLSFTMIDIVGSAVVFTGLIVGGLGQALCGFVQLIIAAVRGEKS